MDDSPIDSRIMERRRFFLGFPARPRHLWALVPGVLLAWFALPTFLSMHPIWVGHYDYSHGYLVLAAAVLLVVLELRRRRLGPLEPSWFGLACLTALVSLTVAAHASSTLFVARAALPALWMAAIWALIGGRNAQRFVLPLGFLYFAIPIWEPAIEPLRRLTIAVVSVGIRFLDVPAFIDGNFIHLPSGVFEVLGGCAGLRYALVASTLGALAGLFYHHHWKPTLLLTLCGFGLALVGNWFRVFTMVLVGYYSEMQHYLVVHDHNAFGWVVFAVFMVPLFYIDRRLQSTSPTAPSVAPDRGAAGAVRRAAGYFACAVLTLGVVLNYRIAEGNRSLDASIPLASPDVPGWIRVADWGDAWRPDFPGATAHVASWYVDGTERVGAYVALYLTQGQGGEVVSIENRPQGQLATVVARRRTSVLATSGVLLPFQELEVTDPTASRRLVWVGLRVAGESAASEVEAKLKQLAGTIRGRRDAQVLVLTAPCVEECGKARASLSRYAVAATEQLYEQVDRAQSAALDSRGATL